MNVKIHDSWRSALQSEFEAEYFHALVEFVKNEYRTKKVYPQAKNIFRAFDLCPLNEVKVVILGQDPYHGPNQANGLCFAVNEGFAHPPSLRNIFQEIYANLGYYPKSSSLTAWAKQGVLLLNSSLTVIAGQAGSHQGKGWEKFTDAVIKTVSSRQNNVVFILWGRYAQNKEKLIDIKKHLIIKSPHPSPLSAHRGFFGSKPFSKVNKYLKWHGKKEIDWIG